jgi:hypothetical protein
VGRIRCIESNQIYWLESHNLAGRAPHCQLRLKDVRVSNEHASIGWRDYGWALRDLGSTNGTWVGGQLVAAGMDVPLVQNTEIAFGERVLGFRVEDVAAPEPMVAPVAGGSACMLHDGVIAVPSQETAHASLYRGITGAWRIEHGDHVGPILPGTVFDVQGSAWRFSCPMEWQSTIRTRHRLVGGSTFHFDVSSDEEQVSLTVELERESIPMGQMSGFYLLLILARLRAAEASELLPHAECGWVHRAQLMDMLRCGEQQLNVWVHRIRTRFSAKGFLDYASVIERRDGSGQLRIGAERALFRSAQS